MAPRLLGIIQHTMGSLKKSAPKDGEVTILKSDDETRMVWGWASISTVKGKLVEDAHGDTITTKTLGIAAHDYMANSRAGKQEHGGPRTGRAVESMMFTNQLQKALGIDLGFEGWLIGYKVENDEVWAAVKSGKLRSFSVGGTGIRRKNV